MDRSERLLGSPAAVALATLVACAPPTTNDSEGSTAALRPPDGSDHRPARIEFGPDSNVEGEASFRFPSAKEIRLDWFVRFEPEATRDVLWGGRAERTRLWPTELSGAGPRRLAVAGRDAATGHTVVELWTFAETGRVPPPPSGARAPEFQVALWSKEVVFDERTPGLRLVRTMFPVHADPDRLLVLFEDSRDLWGLDLEQRTSTLVLASTERSGAPHEPALARDFADRWSGRHAEHGDVYVLTPEDPAESDALVLFDRDRDGAIDEHRTVTVDEFRALGLADGERYERLGEPR